MARYCVVCGRKAHKGTLCDMAQLDDGRVVHASRLDQGRDVWQDIEDGRVKVKNRWIKKKVK